MMHHLAYRSVADDAFAPSPGPGDAVVTLDAAPGSATRNVRHNLTQELRRLGIRPSPAALDLADLAMAVYSADAAVRRDASFDGWTRWFHLHLPTRELARWEPLTPTVEELLNFLTGDRWDVSFRERAADEQSADEVTPAAGATAVSLFSGGMDSFIGAIDRLESGEVIALVGHHGAGTTNLAQDRVFRVLERHYPGRALQCSFYVQAPKPAAGERENTTRGRSILFLSLGALAADGFGEKLPLFVPENGLISLNPPLTDARRGTLSTRTTHSYVLQLFQSMLDGLGLGMSLDAPYRFLTKGEMAQGVLEHAAFVEGVHETVSCSHPEVGRWAGGTPGQHCGYCVPCIIRRASLLAVGLDDPSRFTVDVVRHRPEATSERGRDVRAFAMATLRMDPDDRRQMAFRAIETGPLPPDAILDYAEVLGRGLAEVKRFLHSWPVAVTA